MTTQTGWRARKFGQRKTPKFTGSGKLSRKRQISYRNRNRAMKAKKLL